METLAWLLCSLFFFYFLAPTYAQVVIVVGSDSGTVTETEIADIKTNLETEIQNERNTRGEPCVANAKLRLRQSNPAIFSSLVRRACPVAIPQIQNKPFDSTWLSQDPALYNYDPTLYMGAKNQPDRAVYHRKQDSWTVGYRKPLTQGPLILSNDPSSAWKRSDYFTFTQKLQESYGVIANNTYLVGGYHQNTNTTRWNFTGMDIICGPSCSSFYSNCPKPASYTNDGPIVPNITTMVQLAKRVEIVPNKSLVRRGKVEDEVKKVYQLMWAKALDDLYFWCQPTSNISLQINCRDAIANAYQGWYIWAASQCQDPKSEGPLTATLSKSILLMPIGVIVLFFLI